jgi:hypothetical protein
MPLVCEPSHSVTVFIAGDLATARASLRRQCMEEGLCVTLTATEFVYTSGMESGVAVGLQNYPRFPKSREEIKARALAIAHILIRDLYQSSALVVAPDETIWINNRPETK